MSSIWLGKTFRATALSAAVFMAGLSASPTIAPALAADVASVPADTVYDSARSDTWANTYIIGFRRPALAAADRENAVASALPRTWAWSFNGRVR